MAQIPYSPVPTVAPSEAPTPGFRLNTPEGAFGGGVAGATQGLGQSISSTGNELFGRAIAMQQLANESEAREADSNYMVAAGDLHAKYNSLQGKAAVDAYPEYTKNLKELRVKMRDGLSSQISQKMFDAQSLGTMGRSIFNGAGHAASETKKYAIGTVTAQMELDAKSVEDTPNDEALFKDKLKRVQDGARELSALQGLGPGSPQEQALMLKATSKLWAQRLVGQSRTAPFEAAKALDANKTMMTQDDYLRVDGVVRTQGRAVGSANIANQVYNPDKTLKDMEDDAKAEAKRLAPDDPLLAQAATSAVQQKYNQDKHATASEKASNEQTVLMAIQRGVKNDQELLADPTVAAAYNALPPNSTLRKKPLNYQITTYNNDRDQEEQNKNLMRLRGLAKNDPAGFLNTDIQDLKLNPGQRNEVLVLRDKVIKQAGGDVRVQHAMMDLRGARAAELNALKIYKRDPNVPEDYDKFTGMLEAALNDHLAVHKEPADYDTIVNKIGPKLMRTFDEEGRFFGTNVVPSFKPSTYTQEYKTFETAYKANFPGAKDEVVYKAYQRFQWKLLNSSSKGKAK